MTRLRVVRTQVLKTGLLTTLRRLFATIRVSERYGDVVPIIRPYSFVAHDSVGKS